MCPINPKVVGELGCHRPLNRTGIGHDLRATRDREFGEGGSLSRLAGGFAVVLTLC